MQRLSEEVRGDFESLAALKGVPFPSATTVLDLLALPGTLTVLGFRVAVLARRVGLSWIGRIVRGLVSLLFGADLSPQADVAPGLALPHPFGVAIGPDARLGRRARLMGNVRIGVGSYREPLSRAPAVVGDDCWLFDGAVVSAGADVADRVVVSTNTVVHGSFGPDVILMGDPARVVRHRVAPSGGAVGEVARA